ELMTRAPEASAATGPPQSIPVPASPLKAMGRKVYRIVRLVHAANKKMTARALGDSVLAASRGEVEGFLDGVTDQHVIGWAWEKTKADEPTRVNVYDGELLLATVRADMYRRDLMKAGKGEGKHGFRYIIPAHLKDGQLHVIRTTDSTTNVELTGSPVRI